MKPILINLLIILFGYSLSANNLEITNLSQSGNVLTFEVSWENSWRSALEFHDAVWIFVKQAPNGGPSWTHANISDGTTEQVYQLVISSDHVGVFLRRSSNGNGNSSAIVQLTVDNPIGAYRDYKVFGIEMVYVPTSSFYMGDGSGSGFHRGDDVTESYLVTGEGSISVGNTSDDIDGSSYYGDDISAGYPKGYDNFYCMKYKITQSQIIDFLNCLNRAQQDTIVAADLSESNISNVFILSDTSSPENRNGVRCESNIGTQDIVFYNDLNNNGVLNEIDDGQSLACNHIDKDLFLAYCDWTGLAPMTRFEYEKSCRGPLPAVVNEYAWGSSTYTTATSIQNSGMPDEKFSNSGVDVGVVYQYGNAYRVGLSADSTTDRGKSGATYYGILDMTSPMSERMVPVSSNTHYHGEHGDGLLRPNGRYNMTSLYATTNYHLIKKYGGGLGSVSRNGGWGNGGGWSGTARAVRRL